MTCYAQSMGSGGKKKKVKKGSLKYFAIFLLSGHLFETILATAFLGVN